MKSAALLIATAMSLLITFTAKQARCQVAASTGEITPQTIDALVKKNMEASGMVGLSAAIIVNQKLVWMKGYGYADKANNIPFTPNTVINIASITKTITGVCVMRAVDEGKLSLDADINTYLPFKVINPYFPKEKITLRNIGTHTSGITDREPIYDSVYHYGGDHPTSLDAFMRSYFDPAGKFYAPENFLKQQPGTYWEYSNLATALAGYIVERVTGKSLMEYSMQHIFKPLGMKNTGWLLADVDLNNHSKLYDKQGDTLKLIPLYGLASYPDGGVRSSVSDLSKFFIAMLNDGVYNGKRIIKKVSLDTMQHYQFTAAHKPDNVDLTKRNAGIFWATKDNARKIGYGGTDPGLKTEMLASPSKDVAVILFTNTTLTQKDLLKYYFGIYEELWQYGIQLRDAAKR